MRQLKRKRPGYGDILALYVKVRQAKMASQASVEIDPATMEERWQDRLEQAGFWLLRKSHVRCAETMSRSEGEHPISLTLMNQ